MADYIEFTVSVNENSGTDSQSSIDERVKNNSDRPSEENKLTNQARQNMRENNSSDTGDAPNGKAVKSYIMNQVVKEAANTGIRIAETAAVQQFTYGGNTAALNKMNNSINHIKSGVSITTSMIGYATAGATMGGPLGAGIGVAVGTIFTLVDSLVNYNTNKAKVEWDLQNDFLQAQMSLNRLGVASSGRGRVSFKEYRL